MPGMLKKNIPQISIYHNFRSSSDEFFVETNKLLRANPIVTKCQKAQISRKHAMLVIVFIDMLYK
jgi:hypothetical protein